jgi:hypothetical protein
MVNVHEQFGNRNSHRLVPKISTVKAMRAKLQAAPAR